MLLHRKALQLSITIIILSLNDVFMLKISIFIYDWEAIEDFSFVKCNLSRVIFLPMSNAYLKNKLEENDNVDIHILQQSSVMKSEIENFIEKNAKKENFLVKKVFWDKALTNFNWSTVQSSWYQRCHCHCFWEHALYFQNFDKIKYGNHIVY